MSGDCITIVKLASDGTNWVTYRDRMIWRFNSRRWADHLTSATTPQTYINACDINGQTPAQRWEAEEAAGMNMIASSVPDHVFNRIKNRTNAHEVYRSMSPMATTPPPSYFATLSMRPKCRSPLIVSIGCITSGGSSVTFENNSCKIKNMSGKIISNIPASSNGLYKVEHSHFVASRAVWGGSQSSHKAWQHLDLRSNRVVHSRAASHHELVKYLCVNYPTQQVAAATIPDTQGEVTHSSRSLKDIPLTTGDVISRS